MSRHLALAVRVTGLLVTLGTCAALGNSTSAQITPDATLGLERSVVTPNVMIRGLPSSQITGGAIRGANLFHSFQEFSIPAGMGAYFTNPTGIENILTRVTGSNPSNILGRLGVLGNANVFLLNPNGIIFGPNASLDLGGSFLGTTASSILFTDGSKFSASPSQNKPLLTVSVPFGLGFDTTPRRIVNQSRAIEPGNTQPVGLAVQTGKTLALVGGDVLMDGGILRAPGGRIELGSVQSGQVGITPTPNGWTLGYAGVQNFGDILLSGAAVVDTSGDRGGYIQIQGRRLSLNSGANIFSITSGAQVGGTIAINATDSVEITGTGNYAQFIQRSIDGTFKPDDTSTGIFSSGVGTGGAGNIVINTGKFSASNGAYVLTSTFGSGGGGNLSLNADSVSLSASSLSSGTQFGSTGKAGNLTIDTRFLLLRDNGLASAASLGAGQGGNLTVNASESVELVGTNRIILPGGASFGTSLSILTFGAGNAGDLQVTTGRLTVRDGATIDANSGGQARGGNVTITARDSVELSGRSSDRIPSAVSAGGNPGDGGNITIATGNLIIQDGSGISASSFANAGNVFIRAKSVILSNRALLEVVSPAGEGGNIQIATQNLQLLNNSGLTATAGFAGGTGNGGNLTLNADTLVNLGNSNITANAFQGRGGNIKITTQGIFQSADSIISASSARGINGVVEIKNFGIDLKNILTPNSKNFISVEKAIAGSCLARRNVEQGKFVYTGTGGLEPTPYDAFSAQYDVTQVQPISGKVGKNSDTNSSATAPWKIGDPIVEARAIVRTPDGRILLTTLPQEEPAQADDLVCKSN